jgi:hypothetical protein
MCVTYVAAVAVRSIYDVLAALFPLTDILTLIPPSS